MGDPRPGLLTPKRLALLEALRRDEPATGRGRTQAPAIVPVSRDKELPLSFAQQRLWFLYQLNPESPLYNVSGNIWFTGVLDIEALQRAVNEIVRRHEILRTSFAEVDGVPKKVIKPELVIEMPVVDLRHLSEEGYRAELHRLATKEALEPFDLARGPLLRTIWLRLRDHENLVLFTKHHIVSDGWSVGSFLRELALLYEAFSSGKPSPLPELAIQHSDYAYWQRNWLQGEALEERLAYWKQQLAGAPMLLELPTDRPRPAVQSYRGGWKVYSLPLELTRSIRAFSRHEEVTLFMILLAAFDVLLWRYSGQDDVVVGSPISNRSRLETEELIGVVFNTLLLRVSLAGDPTFRELVHSVRETALNAYAHQDLPFEQLVEALQPVRSLSHSPLFQVMFVLQNSPMPEFRLPNLTLKKFDFHSQTSKFDITWSVDEKDAFVYEKEQTLTGSIEYSTDLFDRSTIERMLAQYATLLEAALAEPDTRISRLPLLPADELRLVLHDWNATAHEGPEEQRLPDLLDAQLARTPEAVALRHEHQALDFRELHARANRLAHWLQERGIGPESVVAVCLERTPELIVALLAVLKAGGAYLPLDPAYPADRLAFMLEDAHAAVLLTQAALLDRMPADVATPRLCLDRDGEQWAGLPATAPRSTATPDNLAYLIYTSGSTGRPKGVAISHRNAVNMLDWAREAFPAPDRAGVLAATSVCFDLSIYEIFLPLAWGGTVVLARNVLDLPRLPGAESVTLVNTVPSVLTELLRDERLPSSVRCVNLAGERLPAELVRSLAARHPGVRIANLYGPSETTTYSTAADLDPARPGAPPIGVPIRNTQVYLLDREGQPVPIGAPGELCIGGAGVARGYLEREELTAERFVPDPFAARPGARLYRTGDLARWRADGQLDYLGRSDHQIKLRGFRIELGEIEHALGQHPAVREAVVVTRAESPEDVRLVAYVVPEDGADGQLDGLRAFLKERLPEHMLPNVTMALGRLPRTPNGKIDRRALPDPFIEETHTVFAPPRTDAERRLAEVWQAVLRVPRVGLHDNFFALGGHSLLATRVVARIRQEVHVELPLRAIFEAPTIAELAPVFEGLLPAGAPAARRQDLRPVPRGSSAPLSFSQQRIWFLDQLAPASTAYTIPAAFRLVGRLDRAALERSLDAIVQRHEALRTTFALRDREPVQEIHPTLRLELPCVSLRDLPLEGRDEAVLRFARDEAGRPFDLERGPLVRVSLLELDDQHHVLVTMLHHIIADGWSMGVLLGELTALYEVFAAGRPATLPSLPIQYADFAIWQRQRLQGELLEQQSSYWRRQLDGAPALLNLPTDYPRPALQAHRGSRATFTLPSALFAGLERLSRQHEATLFMTLLCAWQALLARYSGQTDVSVGAPVAGRSAGETEGLIGCFINTLVLRGDLSGNPSFAELLRRVRRTALDAYTHDDLPFENLIEALQPERSLSYSPLFQVLFVLQNTPLPQLDRGGLHVQPIDLPNATAKLDLTLALVQAPDGLRGSLEYDLDLFAPATIEHLLADYLALLEAVAQRPELCLAELPVSPPAHAVAALAPRRIGVGAGARPVHELPRTATERALAAIWQELLRLPQVGVHDDFFALGGHSLLAVQMLVRVRASLHVELDLRHLFEARGLAQLALLIDATARHGAAPATAAVPGRSPLVPLQAGDGGRPCFCIHPGDGNVVCYTGLAGQLGTGLPVYALEARGLDGLLPPQMRIEAMAANYLDAIRALQPEGPYRLIGWSLGGLIAFEMAQQLVLQDQTVSLLAMLDTSFVDSIPATIDEAVFPLRFVQDLARLRGGQLPAPEIPDGTPPEELLACLVQQARDARLLPPEVGLADLRNRYKVFRANARAMLAYQVRPYPGQITYIQAQESPDRTEAWGRMAQGGCVARMVPGSHYGLLQPPQVELLARELRARLEEPGR